MTDKVRSNLNKAAHFLALAMEIQRVEDNLKKRPERASIKQPAPASDGAGRQNANVVNLFGQRCEDGQGD